MFTLVLNASLVTFRPADLSLGQTPVKLIHKIGCMNKPTEPDILSTCVSCPKTEQSIRKKCKMDEVAVFFDNVGEYSIYITEKNLGQ